ncbi:hypothetical protein Tco_0586914 [Tanacetum coccineum]
MRDANPIRTLGDYSKPSHEGYKNTIELPVGNNVVPLRSDTIWLVQNRCSFHGLRSEDPNQHLKDFLKLVDSLDLDGENRERMRLCLFQFSLRDQASNWLESDERLRKLRPDEVWVTIEELAKYEDEGWNDTVIPDVISLMGRSEGVFRMKTNEMYQPPLEPSRQEEFEHIVMNFILDQEERVRQLEEYMKEIIGDFIQLSSETMSKRARITRGQSSSSQGVSIKEKVQMLMVFESGVHQMHHDALSRCRIHSGDIIDWDFLASQGLAQAFFESKDPFSVPQWVNLFQTNENVYRDLVREFFASFKFFASFEFDASPCRYDPNHLGVRESATLSGLRKGVTVKANHLLLGFWPTIGDDGFNVGNMKVVAIRDLKAVKEDEEDNEGDEEAGGGAGHEGAGGSAHMYQPRKFLIKNEEEFFTDAGDDIGINT